MIFQHRTDAGQKLGKALKGVSGDLVIMGLARGGVVVAAEVARILHAPLSIALVRKVGAPGNEELALGAIAESGPGVFNEDLISLLGVSREYLRKEVERQRELILQRKEAYFLGIEPVSTKGKTVILVDDGIATGASIKVVIQSVRAQGALEIILAVPVAAQEGLAAVTPLVDKVFCLFSPMLFQAVGAFYQEFPEVTDEEILAILKDYS